MGFPIILYNAPLIELRGTGTLDIDLNILQKAVLRDLRLWLLDQLLARDDDFRRAFKIIHETDYSCPIQPLDFNVPTDLVAV